ncbi:MAG: 23S rRNA (guanosine(2251)-2'-O)-methyltransferase RlmB [Gordonia sp. (in: high G+C Gram-positive bacteria)]|uniref:23S rRNA (guanosine(2251)-2'-O)-methyltransferase RlmB n=1 Tax=Gordonia sp. (in: high G+C Gram-positive bacteria) TaxID=84139 RepID=UPI003BB675AA
MAGNSKRKGAIRKDGTKKGQVVGSGGQRRRGLEARGATPKAVDRTYHAAHKKAKVTARAKATAGRQQQRRRDDGPEYVVGRNPVVECLRAGIPATALYVMSTIDADDRVREAIGIAGDMGIAILEAGKPELDRMTVNGLHQGLALQVPEYSYAHPDDLLADAMGSAQPALLVALDNITDPRNLGAVIRSVAAFGGDGVLIPQRRSASVTAVAWRTSAGAAARLPVAQAPNLTRTLVDWAKAGCQIVGLDADGDVTLDEYDGTGPTVIVVGSEGKGLSRLVRETCDSILSVPMAGNVESLNASVAAGVVLAEFARQRRNAGV